jgi:hypothetical protein
MAEYKEIKKWKTTKTDADDSVEGKMKLNNKMTLLEAI